MNNGGLRSYSWKLTPKRFFKQKFRSGVITKGLKGKGFRVSGVMQLHLQKLCTKTQYEVMYLIPYKIIYELHIYLKPMYKYLSHMHIYDNQNPNLNFRKPKKEKRTL
jgi:hypothetical protein